MLRRENEGNDLSSWRGSTVSETVSSSEFVGSQMSSLKEQQKGILHYEILRYL